MVVYQILCQQSEAVAYMLQFLTIKQPQSSFDDDLVIGYWVVSVCCDAYGLKGLVQYGNRLAQILIHQLFTPKC